MPIEHWSDLGDLAIVEVSENPSGSIELNDSTGSLALDLTKGYLYQLSSGSTHWKPMVAGFMENKVFMVRNDQARLYETINAALSASSDGSIVGIGPGNWGESFTIPQGVVVRGLYSRSKVNILGGASTGNRIEMGADTILENVTIHSPSDTEAAIYNNSSTCNISNISIIGNSSSSFGIKNLSNGGMAVNKMFFDSGSIGVLICSSGRTLINDVVVTTGSMETVVRACTGSLRLNNVSVPNDIPIDHGLFALSASVDANNLYFLGCSTALRIGSDLADVSVNNSDLRSTTTDLLVDPSLSSGSLNLLNCLMTEANFSIPGAWAENAQYTFVFRDTQIGDESYRIWSELHVGHAEKGSESVFGKGDSYVRGMVILTTDNTATSTTEGGNFTDVSTSASYAEDGLSFSFQGTTANHTILVGSELSETSDTLKHWGVKVKQLIAAVEVTEKSFAIEIWNGSAWTEVGVMASNSIPFYRYANSLFIRSNVSEHVRYGIDGNTSWSKKTIDGKNLYWSRIRVTDALTTAPTFDQFKISPSRFEANENGSNTYHGQARFIKTVLNTGNIFAKGGGTTDGSFTIGDTADVTTGWAHSLPNAELNGNGDSVFTQFTIPLGVDTSYPLKVVVNYYVESPPTSGEVTVALSLLPVQIVGNLVADSAGGILPVARSAANTEFVTDKAATAQTVNITADTEDKIYSFEFEGFDISDYYPNDIIFMRFELDDDKGGGGGPTRADVGILSFEVDALAWIHGGDVQ